ncbi:hypothetical protein Bca101_053467 [Brassica carinata]
MVEGPQKMSSSTSQQPSSDKKHEDAEKRRKRSVQSSATRSILEDGRQRRRWVRKGGRGEARHNKRPGKDKTRQEARKSKETYLRLQAIKERLLETNTETNEVQETVDETVLETNTETHEVQDTMEGSVPLLLNAPTNETTVSPCKDDNQEEIQHASDSFPTPIEDESQQYLEQKDSSHFLVPQEELSSQMSLETSLEDKERKEEKELEAVMEMLCRAENKLLDVTLRLERFRTPKGRKKLGKSPSNLHEEDSVVYILTAEIMETQIKRKRNLNLLISFGIV